MDLGNARASLNLSMKLNEFFCVHCKHILEAHAPMDNSNNEPSKGDITICAYCGTIMQFIVNRESLCVEKITDLELSEMKKEQSALFLSLMAVQTFIQTNQKQKVKKIIVLGTPSEDQPCEYCGQMSELRPYGKNGARICFDCGMKPENKEYVEKAINDIFTGQSELPSADQTN